ncbi:MAG: hypothetical protein EP329_09865 [Deltaproteobacteria bacterium]|nr:MAG: hypothetical protein EP329_09865 [Deltaproteobacteria bacterium]
MSGRREMAELLRSFLMERTRLANSIKRTEDFASRFEARAALEAMRAGVVNRAVVRHATYGRDAELAQLLNGFRRSPGGSTQVLVGQYGSGKSHLCELLALRAEEEGYAVIRLEMGSSSNSAEHPRSLVMALPRAFAVRIDGRRLAGSDALGILLRALRRGGFHFTAENDLLESVYREFPGPNAIMKRFDRLQRDIPVTWARFGFQYLPDLAAHLHVDVPNAMTAANHAVNKINWLAHELAHAGVPGLVMILDEAERTEWASTSYRAGRAWDVMVGLALAASNMDTSGLKHYRDSYSPRYLGQSPSRIHVVMAFTHAYGLARSISRDVCATPLQLTPFDHHGIEALVGQIHDLYKSAHGTKVAFPAQEIVKEVKSQHVNDGTREIVRHAIAAMDHRRYHGGRKR